MGLFNKTSKVEKKIEEPENRLGLIGFKGLKSIQWHSAHEAREWGDYIFAKYGACWRLFTKEGYPLTTYAHSIRLGTFGDLECQVGAREWTVEMEPIRDQVNGLRQMISDMIDERLKK